MQIHNADSIESGAVDASDGAATIPSGHTAAAEPRTAGSPACAIVALSDDALLLEALTGAADEAASVSSSPSMDRFIDQLVANGAGIALIDAACVAPSLRSFLITLREQFPQLLLLVVGSAQVQSQIAAQIADGIVFRFVHKPASSQRLRLFLDAAVRQQLSPVSAGTTDAGTAPAGPEHPEPATGGRRGRMLGVVGAIAAALALAAWFIAHRNDRTEPVAASIAPPEPASEPSAPAAPPATPAAAPGASAAPETSQKLPIQPGAAPDSSARDTALERAQRAAQGARADQLAVYLQLANKRLASGALIEPADDSARSYLDSAVALAPDDPEVRAASLALGEAMITRFRHALAAGDAADAQRWLAACSSYHIGSATLAQLTAQLQQLQELQTSASTAPARELPPVAAPPSPAAPAASPAPTGSPAPGVPAAPAPPAVADSTPAAAVPAAGEAPAVAAPVAPVAAAAPAPPTAHAAPGDDGAATVVNESALKRVAFVAPTYPADALDRNIGGWVDLEFTVTAQGTVTDVQVTGAEPRNTFESAARSALERCRYQPVLRNGTPVAQRARIRVRFTP